MNRNRIFLRSLICLLAVLLLASFSLIACHNGNGPTASTDTSSVNTRPDETQVPIETKWIDTLPDDLNYEGYDFVIGWANAFNYNEISFTYEDALGDTINAEIYNRNRRVEERLGITISEYRMGNWDEVASSIEEMSILGDDAAYTVCCADTWFLFQSSLNGSLLPLNTIKQINIQNPWWDTDTIRNMYSLGTDTYYFVSGDINYCDDYALQCMFFNKVLFDQYQLETPYQKVRDGVWTLDALNSYLVGFPVDNGDAILDENDCYGITTNAGALMHFLNAFNEPVLSLEKGEISLNDSAALIDKVDRIVDFFGSSRTENVIVERAFGYEVGNEIFPSGNALFVGNGMIGSIISFRFNMEDDFGIIPAPKYNEDQKEYRSSLNTAYGSAYAILRSDPDTERTGTILETMGYFSTDTIRKEIIEKNVKVKATRDDDSAEMLEILFRSKFYDLGGWGTDIYEKGMAIIVKGVNTYSSALDEVRDLTAAQFEKTTDYYS